MTRPPAVPDATGPGETEEQAREPAVAERGADLLAPDEPTGPDKGGSESATSAKPAAPAPAPAEKPAAAKQSVVDPEPAPAEEPAEAKPAAESTKSAAAKKSAAAAKPAKPAEAKPRRSRAKHRGPVASDAQLEKVLEALRVRIRGIKFADGMPGAEEGTSARVDVLDQLDHYVLPRVRNADTPLLIAVAGSTGAGKSTLVNSLVGEQVTTTGVRRPTTNSPVLACNPKDVGWFSEASFLPSLPRVRQEGLAMPGKDGMLVLAASECMPEGVALLDTPDVDSAVAAHHEFAAKFLDAADLWVFVTTSRRYADARVWEFLQVARDRDTSLAVVMSRVPRRGRGQLVEHFTAMLDANGLGHATQFVIPETDQLANGRFIANTADQIREYLADVAGDLAQRETVSRRTFLGVLDSFRTRVPELARQVETQVEAGRTLQAGVESAFSAALAEIDESTRNGSLLRGNVLARWQDVATSGALARSVRLRSKKGARGRKVAARNQEDTAARVRGLAHAIQESLEALLVSGVERAVEDVVERWSEVEGGNDLAESKGVRQVSDDFDRRVRETVKQWRAKAVEMVTGDGVAKRSVARFVTYDKEAFSLVLIIGLLGFGTSEFAVSQGTSAQPQRLLKGLFGSDSLRNISSMARQDLRSRVTGLLEEEKRRFTDALATAGLPEEADAVHLYQATYNLEIAR